MPDARCPILADWPDKLGRWPTFAIDLLHEQLKHLDGKWKSWQLLGCVPGAVEIQLSNTIDHEIYEFSEPIRHVLPA